MTASSEFGADHTFDDFLYALVGGQTDQMPLSVLSALTRLNLDPWEEAFALSKLPPDVAIERLAGFIARLPAINQPDEFDCSVAAQRLVGLLPQASRSLSLPMRKIGGVELPSITLPRMLSRSAVLFLAAILLGTVALLFAMAREQASQISPSELPSSSSMLLPQTL